MASSRVIDDARREDSAAAETMDRPYVFGEGLRAVRAVHRAQRCSMIRRALHNHGAVALLPVHHYGRWKRQSRGNRRPPGLGRSELATRIRNLYSNHRTNALLSQGTGGAGDRIRTDKSRSSTDCGSVAFTNFATPAPTRQRTVVTRRQDATTTQDVPDRTVQSTASAAQSIIRFMRLCIGTL